MRKSRNAFTLVEILIVVGIITLLGAILLKAVMSEGPGTKRTEILLQQLVSAIETMKVDYGFTGAIGVDPGPSPTPPSTAELDKIDLGKELDPKSPFWKPPLNKDDMRINKRLKTYYNVHEKQVIGNQFVDPFGNPVRYRVVLEKMDVNGNGLKEHYAKERLVALGSDGKEGTDDDITMPFSKPVFLGEDKK